MGYFISKQTNNTSLYVDEIIADTLADLADIDTSSFSPGTIVLVLEDTSVHMLNTQKEWKQL